MHQLISADRVVCGPAGDVIIDGAVLLEGASIVHVGTRAEVERRAPGGTRPRHFPGHTILPGLINAHVHLAFDASADFLEPALHADDPDLLLGMADRAQRALFSGVTTLRDLGDRNGLTLRLRDAIDRGEFRGPRILAAGAPVTTPGGHCHFLGGAVDRGEEALREHVRQLAASGVDVIKVMASGGSITATSVPMWASQFTSRELGVVVEQAHGAGLPVAAHAHGTDAIVSAVEAGADTIEHCGWMTENGVHRREEIAARMAAQGTAVCTAWSPNWRAIMERMPAERIEQIYGRLSWMDSLGVALITGTDAGLRDSHFEGIVDLLELYAHLGVANERVLAMATSGCATALGIGDRTGRVRPGHSADLLVAAGNPLEDLSALRRLRVILARGREFRPDLDAEPDAT